MQIIISVEFITKLYFLLIISSSFNEIASKFAQMFFNQFQFPCAQDPMFQQSVLAADSCRSPNSLMLTFTTCCTGEWSQNELAYIY